MTDNKDIDDTPIETEIEVNDIYKRLLQDDTIVLSLYRQDLQHVRKSLSTIKSRDATKMKDSGLDADNRKLEFTDITTEEEKKKNGLIVKLRIELKEPAKVRVIGEITTLSGDLI